MGFCLQMHIKNNPLIVLIQSLKSMISAIKSLESIDFLTFPNDKLF